MGGSKCRVKISDRCLNPINAECVDYEGILLQTSTLEEEDCNTVVDVIEDIINQVDENTSDLNFTNFESVCLEIEPADTDRGITIKDVIIAQDAKICDLTEQLENLANPDEPSCEGECCDDGDGCCDILKKYDSYTAGAVIDTIDWTPFNTPSLEYKANKIGTYKFTFEVGSDSGMSVQTAQIGIALNGLAPSSTLFEQVALNNYNSDTVIFIKKMLTNDTARLVGKMIGESDYSIDYVKMIVEKIK